jgi:rubrerythrin
MTEPVTKSLKGTQTEKNLVAAYMSECQASMRYTFYAAQAYKESYFPIQQAFTETADNEAHHAKVFFKYLTGGEVTVDLPVDAGIIGTTEENLVISIKEEQDEGVVQYTAAAKTAEEEGFPEIAERFRSIAAVEKRHEARFQKYLEQVRTNTVWKRDTPIKWVCLVCGYVYEGCEPPQRCPGCHHPMQHFMAADMML